MSRPLRSTATPASSGFPLLRAGPPASAATGTQCLRFLPLARSLSPPVELSPQARTTVSSLAFSRSMQEPQTRLTPPLRRAPPGQQTGIRQAHPEGLARTPGFDAVSEFRRLNSARPTRSPRPSASGTSSWSPPDAIKRAFSGSLTTTVFSQRSIRWFSARPRGPTLEGQSLHLSHSSAYMRDLLHDSSFSVRDTRCSSSQGTRGAG